LSARRGSSIDDCRAMNPRYRNSRISDDVRRASQTHQVPHMGLPQSEPVANDRNASSAPVGASAEAIMPDSRVLKAKPKPAQPAMTRYTNMESEAAGTCTKMMR